MHILEVTILNIEQNLESTQTFESMMQIEITQKNENSKHILDSETWFRDLFQLLVASRQHVAQPSDPTSDKTCMPHY